MPIAFGETVCKPGEALSGLRFVDPTQDVLATCIEEITTCIEEIKSVNIVFVYCFAGIN